MSLVEFNNIAAFVAEPKAAPKAAPKALLICLMEWWGLSNWMKTVAVELADATGFVVAVPDLYHGKVAATPDEATHYMNNLDFPGAVEEIKQTSQYFKQKYNVDKAFVCGFCMGGALSIASAVRTTEFAAAAPFYGIPPLALADPKKANCPIMGFFGERDNHAGFSDPAAAKKLDQALTEGGVEHEIIIYDNVDHAFMNADRPQVYNAEVAKKALAAMVQFFNKHL